MLGLQYTTSRFICYLYYLRLVDDNTANKLYYALLKYYR